MDDVPRLRIHPAALVLALALWVVVIGLARLAWHALHVGLHP